MKYDRFLTTGNSGAMAKYRLTSVLISDRSGITPEILDMIKDDMIKSISKYMEMNPDEVTLHITTHECDSGGNYLPVLHAMIPIRVLFAKGTYL